MTKVKSGTGTFSALNVSFENASQVLDSRVVNPSVLNDTIVD